MTIKTFVVGFSLLFCLQTQYVLGQPKPFEFKGHIPNLQSGKIQLIIDSIPGSVVKISEK